MKVFLAEAFEKKLEAIEDDKETFIEVVKTHFPGTKMNIPLLNTYLCYWRQGKLVVNDRKKRTDYSRRPFHKKNFSQMLEGK